MTRSELYELVWKEPVSHVAKRFGISDVALRKTCVKHNVPTPPLGYWAKLAFGKKVSQPELPTLWNGESEHIHLTVRQPGLPDISVNGDIETRVDNEPFKLKIYETKHKTPHQPTPADFQNQARYDADSKRYPSLYTPRRTVWRTWDHHPSGRLCLELSDPTQHRWNSHNVIGRWYDRKSKFVEDYFGEAIVALAGASAHVKHRRAEAEEKARLLAEQEELRRREKACRERKRKQREYFAKKADAYEEYCR